MPMSGDTMGTEVSTAVKAVFSGKTTEQINAMDADEIWKAVCNAIVAHITANAQTTTTAVQPGLGTAPGTIL